MYEHGDNYRVPEGLKSRAPQREVVKNGFKKVLDESMGGGGSRPPHIFYKNPPKGRVLANPKIICERNLVKQYFFSYIT